MRDLKYYRGTTGPLRRLLRQLPREPAPRHERAIERAKFARAQEAQARAAPRCGATRRDRAEENDNPPETSRLCAGALLSFRRPDRRARGQSRPDGGEQVLQEEAQRPEDDGSFEPEYRAPVLRRRCGPQGPSGGRAEQPCASRSWPASTRGRRRTLRAAALRARTVRRPGAGLFQASTADRARVADEGEAADAARGAGPSRGCRAVEGGVLEKGDVVPGRVAARLAARRGWGRGGPTAKTADASTASAWCACAGGAASAAAARQGEMTQPRWSFTSARTPATRRGRARRAAAPGAAPKPRQAGVPGADGIPPCELPITLDAPPRRELGGRPYSRTRFGPSGAAPPRLWRLRPLDAFSVRPTTARARFYRSGTRAEAGETDDRRAAAVRSRPEPVRAQHLLVGTRQPGGRLGARRGRRDRADRLCDQDDPAPQGLQGGRRPRSREPRSEAARAFRTRRRGLRGAPPAWAARGSTRPTWHLQRERSHPRDRAGAPAASRCRHPAAPQGPHVRPTAAARRRRRGTLPRAELGHLRTAALAEAYTPRRRRRRRAAPFAELGAGPQPRRRRPGVRGAELSPGRGEDMCRLASAPGGSGGARRPRAAGRRRPRREGPR